ncbi:MAG: arylsulfatase A-like enzyme, partial [Planctomycetota bacterium]
MLASLPMLLGLAFSSAEEVPQPNILVVVLDDVGVDSVGVYAEGTDPAPTPIFDSLAQSGVLFRNAWANPICSPSRAEILTGRYGFRTGVGHIVGANSWALALSELTIPEVLARNPALGYRSAAFGKWHLSSNLVGGGDLGPNLQGFEHFAGTWGNIDPGTESYYAYEKLVDGQRAPATGYATTEVVDDALAWIQGSADPWFCYVAFQAPHDPFHAPPAHLHTQDAQINGLDPRFFPRPFYLAMLEAADTEMGRLLAGIGADLANTHVIVLGDNGTPREASIAPFEPE